MDADQVNQTERYQRGTVALNKVCPGIQNSAMNSIEAIAPFFKQYVVETFGDFFSRESRLSLQQRELAVVASLSTLGHAQPQLEFHIEAALNVGCAKEEIVEVISTVSLYGGIPAALNSLRAAAKVFNQNGV